jgi:hypothetical protein
MQVLDERTATGDSPVGGAQALIEEARARTRRRRLYTAVALVVIVLGALLGSIATRGNARPLLTFPVAKSSGAVQTLNLSTTDRYEWIAVVNGQLILSGGPGGSLVPSASDAAQTPAQLDDCHSAVANPVTLKLSDLQTGACENPALYGETVLPINDIALGKTDASTIRIAVATDRGRSYRLGPVVMRYSEFGNTDAEWVYGDGSLWIYDPLVTATSAQLIRVSEQTGAVIQRVAMPQLAEPLLAVDSDGFWLASGDRLGHATSGIYHVAPNVSSPTLVSKLTPTWLVASGHSLWFLLGSDDTKVWHLEGTTLTRTTISPENPGFDTGSSAYGAPGYAATSVGFWYVDYPQESPSFGSYKASESQGVYDLSLTNGSWSTVANLRPKVGYGNTLHFKSGNDSYSVDQTLGIPSSGVALDSPDWADHTLMPSFPIVTLGTSAYLLDPPAHSPDYKGNFSGFSALYRVTPKHA